MEKKKTGQDKFIELDVKKLEHIEAERKRLLGSAMQSLPDIHFMCCPRCSRSLVEKIILDITIVLCEQCRGMWIDDKSLAKILGLSGDKVDNFIDYVTK